jgi:hypothetical protein
VAVAAEEVAVVVAVSLPVEQLSARAAARSSAVLLWLMPAAWALPKAQVLPWWSLMAQRSLAGQQEAPSSSLEAAMPLPSALLPAEDWVPLALPSLRME